MKISSIVPKYLIENFDFVAVNIQNNNVDSYFATFPSIFEMMTGYDQSKEEKVQEIHSPTIPKVIVAKEISSGEIISIGGRVAELVCAEYQPSRGFAIEFFQLVHKLIVSIEVVKYIHRLQAIIKDKMVIKMNKWGDELIQMQKLMRMYELGYHAFLKPSIYPRSFNTFGFRIF